MKSIITFMCLLGAMLFANAQGSTSITGKVIDKTTGTPIPYASIAVKSQGKILTGTLSREDGTFEMKGLPSGPVTIDFQFMGYKPRTLPADLTGAGITFDVGSIALEDEAIKLNDVTVVAERSTIEQKIDRKVINVGRDLTTAGATASEIMNNIPSVNVDQDGKLSLRGNENVRVLVDGRPTTIDPAQLLKQIPSASIKRIELITNPSAKYNPEGMSGIINIVLHKNSNDGFNAALNTSTTFAREPKSANSINANYRTGKVNFFGTYGDSYGKWLNDGNIWRYYGSNAHEVIDVQDDNESHLYKIGMDYYIDDKNTLSVYTNQNHVIGESTIRIDNRFPDSSMNISQESQYLSSTHDAAYNVAYKKLFDKEGRTLDFEANYNRFDDVQRAQFSIDNDTPDDDYQDNVQVDRVNATVNLDYVSPIGTKGTLEVGAEGRFMRTDDDYRTSRPDVGGSMFEYDVDIYSAYVTYGQKFEKFAYQLGLRFESYDVNALFDADENLEFNDDYLTVYPSASFVYTPAEKNQFQISYSRRVDRPSIQQTNPIREFSTPTLTSQGNPELTPQFTNSVELNYTKTIGKGSFTTGIFYRIINDEISRIIVPDPLLPDRDLLTFDNFDTNTAFGFEASANYKITKWWDIQPSVDFSSIKQTGLVFTRDDITNAPVPIERDVTVSALNARMNANFRATRQLRFLIFGFYRGEVENVQLTRLAMYKMDLGGRYSFAGDKATLSIRFNDVFDTMKFAFDSDYPPSRGEFKWESQSIFVGLNYIFGTGKNRELQRKQRESNTSQSGGGMF